MTGTYKLGDLVKAFLKKSGLEEKMEELDLAKDWEAIAGPMIARHTKSLVLKNGTLTISVTSAPLRHTLSFSKAELITRLNEAIGRELIREVVIR